jgi:hypothetical protein
VSAAHAGRRLSGVMVVRLDILFAALRLHS